jgi:hypothetical protein
MKKVLSTLLMAGMMAFYACGPSAEEKAAAEKATQDSINAAQQTANTVAAGDSMARAMADTTKMGMDTAAKK